MTKVTSVSPNIIKKVEVKNERDNLIGEGCSEILCK
jgi:hypothetical protein